MSNTLQQVSTVPVPFVRHFVSLAQIAGRTSNHDVFGAIGPAARNRNDMIYVIRVSQLLLAVIAASFLGAILSLNIARCMSSAVTKAASAAYVIVLTYLIRVLCLITPRARSILIGILLPILFMVSTAVGQYLLTVGVVMGPVSSFIQVEFFQATFPLDLGRLLGMLGAILLLICKGMLPMALVATTGKFIFACFAVMMMSVFTGAISRKLGQWLFFTTTHTTLQWGVHSISPCYLSGNWHQTARVAAFRPVGLDAIPSIPHMRLNTKRKETGSTMFCASIGNASRSNDCG